MAAKNAAWELKPVSVRPSTVPLHAAMRLAVQTAYASFTALCSTLHRATPCAAVGIEIAGALKNVYALAAGAAEGIGFGANTTALVVTRAVAEMNVLATALGR